jgi:carboxymethylenebutenolidase
MFSVCHDTDSRPPAAPAHGGVADHGPLELTSADGTVFAAFRAVPDKPNGRNVVILPDIRGLHAYYEALTERFAEAGFHAVAIDYFARTAPDNVRDDTFDFRAHLPMIKPAQIKDDVAAAVSYLREVNPGPVFTVGFCMGGSHSWRMAAGDLGLAGVIGFYGRPGLVRDVAADIIAPMLLLVAGADAATPREESEAFAAELQAAGKNVDIHVYDGAPHSFFDRSFGEWQEACDDAWRRLIAFTDHYAEETSG